MRKEDNPSLPLLPSPGHAAAEPGARLDAGQATAPGGPVLGKVHLRWPGASLSGCVLAKGTVRPGGDAGRRVSCRRPWWGAGGLGPVDLALAGAFVVPPGEGQPGGPAARNAFTTAVAELAASNVVNRVPVGVVAGQPGAFQAEHDPGPAQRHLGDHLLEPFPAATCERTIGTLRRELLDRLPIVNEHHPRQALTEYLAHHNTARPHRALGQLTPAQVHTRPPEINLAEHRIRRKQVLGGLTHEYQIAA